LRANGRRQSIGGRGRKRLARAGEKHEGTPPGKLPASLEKGRGKARQIPPLILEREEGEEKGETGGLFEPSSPDPGDTSSKGGR